MMGDTGSEKGCVEQGHTEHESKRNNVEEKEWQRRNRKPLLYAQLIVKYPKTMFGVTLGGHIFLTALNFILYVAGYDILPLDLEAFPVDLRGDPACQREYAWNLRDNDTDKINRFTIDKIGPWWERGHSIDDVQLFYTLGSSEGNVFTRDIMQQMEQIENALFDIDTYQHIYCQLESEGGKCTKPTSILRYFDGTYRNISDIFYDPDYQNVVKVLHEANTHQKTSTDFKYFLPKGYRITGTEALGNLTRSHLPMGWPYETGSDKDNQKKLEDFLMDEMVPEIERQTKNLKGGLKVNYASWNIFYASVLPQAFKDMALAIGSLVFIFAFMWFQTRSLWVTGWAVISIITGFCITNIFYRVVLDYVYLGYFHIIAIFIILGIGADDIFVFYNIWRATSFAEYPSLAHRMSDCYSRAAGTMFFTSFTTMMAFVAGSLCPILPIGSFGIFTAVLIAVNYISVIVFFPTVVLLSHLYFDHPCCKPKSKHLFNPSKVANGDLVTADKPKQVTTKQPNIVVRFFRDYFFFFVTHKIIRWIIIVFFLGVIGFFLWSATRLEMSTEEIKIYRKETNLGQALSLAGTGFIPSGDNFVVVYLVWGMGPRDFSSCHKTGYECQGEQVWLDSFDLNTPPAQLALLNFCNELKYGLCAEELDKLMIRNNTFTGQLEVDCFLHEMNVYLKEEEVSLNNSVDLDYPLQQTNMDAFMRAYPNIYEPDELPVEFYRYFELGVSYWLSDGYSLRSFPDYIQYNDIIGEAKDGLNTKPIKPSIENVSVAYYGSKLRYAAIRVNLSLSTQELNHIRGLPVMDNWETFFSNKVKDMPLALRDGFQLTDYIWHWLRVQQTLAYNAILGIVMGLCIALPVLVLATMNVLTGVFATFIIGCNTAAAIGVLPLADWKLDIMVSMNLCLLVGLSVDYVVHLAEGYHLSAHQDRLGRVRDMLENLGISVLSGAITTLGAALFMIFAQIQFFLQFGTFLLSVIGFSLLFSLVFFTAVMGLIGPQGETGSLKPLGRYVMRKLRQWLGTSAGQQCPQCQAAGNGAMDMAGVHGQGASHSQTQSEQPHNTDLCKGSHTNEAFIMYSEKL